MIKFIVITFLISISLLVSGCQDRYRYPCQDPTNWDAEICQKPLCEVNQTCPEHIFKDKVRCKE